MLANIIIIVFINNIVIIISPGSVIMYYLRHPYVTLL